MVDATSSEDDVKPAATKAAATDDDDAVRRVDCDDEAIATVDVCPTSAVNWGIAPPEVRSLMRLAAARRCLSTAFGVCMLWSDSLLRFAVARRCLSTAFGVCMLRQRDR